MKITLENGTPMVSVPARVWAEVDGERASFEERAERAEGQLRDHLAQADDWAVQVQTLRGQRDRLRQALEGLVGGATRAELEQIELGLRLVPVSDEDKAVSLNAIHALLALWNAK